MTRQEIHWREVVQSYPCDTCGAAPGEPCHTPMIWKKWEPHAARSRLASANGWDFPEPPAEADPNPDLGPDRDD